MEKGIVGSIKQTSWPADNISRKTVKSLIPYARNARTHSDAQVAQIAASIKEWGWTNPILVDPEGGIIAGHGRVMAARQLKIEEVPVMVANGWTDAQKKAYILADNQLGLNAGWDMSLLAVEIGDLADAGFNLDLIGFDEKILGDLLNDPTEGLTDPDETPELPEEPVSVLGDVWQLGNHRIVCGDCTDADVVAKALDGVRPHLMVTDPPYGVEYDANWRNEVDRANGKPSGGRAIGKVENDNNADWREAFALFPGDVAYVWHAGNKAHIVAESLISCDLNIRAQIIWAKQQFVIGRGDYHPQHEPCWYAVRKAKPGHYDGGRKQSTIWNIDKPRKSETGHSTQKPVECMKRPIENNSSPGQAVYEPFSGSGTTIIAAEMTGRACHAIELNQAYVDMAVKRWENFTGKKAKLEEDGRTFEDIKAVRNG
jgi:DNA modification methylase